MQVVLFAGVCLDDGKRSGRTSTIELFDVQISHPRIALVTGASRSLGLGFAVARLPARSAHHVILTARMVEPAEQRAADLRRDGFSATALPLDLADPASISQLTAGLTDSVHHLVWAATLGADGPSDGFFRDGKLLPASAL